MKEIKKNIKIANTIWTINLITVIICLIVNSDFVIFSIFYLFLFFAYGNWKNFYRCLLWTLIPFFIFIAVFSLIKNENREKPVISNRLTTMQDILPEYIFKVRGSSRQYFIFSNRNIFCGGHIDCKLIIEHKKQPAKIILDERYYQVVEFEINGQKIFSQNETQKQLEQQRKIFIWEYYILNLIVFLLLALLFYSRKIVIQLTQLHKQTGIDLFIYFSYWRFIKKLYFKNPRLRIPMGLKQKNQFQNQIYTLKKIFLFLLYLGLGFFIFLIEFPLLFIFIFIFIILIVTIHFYFEWFYFNREKRFQLIITLFFISCSFWIFKFGQFYFHNNTPIPIHSQKTGTTFGEIKHLYIYHYKSADEEYLLVNKSYLRCFYYLIEKDFCDLIRKSPFDGKNGRIIYNYEADVIVYLEIDGTVLFNQWDYLFIRKELFSKYQKQFYGFSFYILLLLIFCWKMERLNYQINLYRTTRSK